MEAGIMNKNKVLAKRLRKLREKKNMTQTELGKLFNLSKQAISSYETGGSEPPSDTLQSFADFFDVSIDYLLGRTDDPRPLNKIKEEFEAGSYPVGPFLIDDLDINDINEESKAKIGRILFEALLEKRKQKKDGKTT